MSDALDARILFGLLTTGKRAERQLSGRAEHFRAGVARRRNSVRFIFVAETLHLQE